MLDYKNKTHLSKWVCITAYYVLTTIVKSLTENTILILALSIAPVCVLIIITIVCDKGKIKLYDLVIPKYILGVMLFCYISSLWAENSLYAIGKGNNLLLILVLTTSIYMCICDEEDAVNGILQSIMWGGYIVVIYAFYRYGVSYIMLMLAKGVRIYNPILNANEIGICAGYSILICLYIVLYRGLNVVNVLAIVLAAISLLMLAASGSRKALIMVVGGVLLLFIFRNIDNKRILNSLAKIVMTFVALIIIGLIISKTSLFEATFGRIETMINGFLGSGTVDTSTQVRLRMVEIGKELFYRHPILGIGMDNAQIYAGAEFNRKGFYLHNNYIEMLADGGILGFVIYYWIYAYLLIGLIKKRLYRSGEYMIVLILLLTYLIMDYGMVTYETKSTYIFLMLFVFEYTTIKQKHELKRKWKYITNQYMG